MKPMAEDGKEAIKLYKELRPNVVIMDLTMQKMDGIDAVKEIRTKAQAPV